MTTSNNQAEKIHELKQQINDYKLLNEALEGIEAATSLQDAIQRIIEQTLRLCSAEEGSVVLLDPCSPQNAKPLIRRGESSQKILDHFLNQLLAGRALSKKKPFLTNDLTEAQKGLKDKYKAITSVLSVPFGLEENIGGVINLITTDQEKRFTERELMLMTLLSKHCAPFSGHEN